MINWTLRTIIVPASLVLAARQLGAALDPAGAGMYTTPLAPTSTGTPTHFISSGMIDQNLVSLLASGPALFAAAQAGATAQGLTLTATLGDATTLVALSDVSTEQPFVALARLGLTITTSSGS